MSVLLPCLSRAFQLPKYQRIHEFFEDGFALTEDDRFKKFDIKLSPWVRALCDWWEEPETPWIFIICGSQLSKTSFMMGTFLFAAQYMSGPTPTLWSLNTEDSAKEFVKTRFKPFLDNSGKEALKSDQWKQEYFRVFNSSVKMGYATTENSLRSKPCRFIYADEIGKYLIPVDYHMMRTRTFEGKRKGVFATTPPSNPDHHSVKAYSAGNFYQWWVPCPHCGEYQPLVFANIDFKGAKKETGEYDFEKIKEITTYRCNHCYCSISENAKLDMISRGKLQCVNFHTKKPIEEKKGDTKTLQISALYSVFTKWSTLAIDFLKATQKGAEALKYFYTDQLGEIFRKLGKTIKKSLLEKFIDEGRAPGFLPDYDTYTAGIDLQRNGDAYFVTVGWKGGPKIAGHILEFGVLPWKKLNEEDGNLYTNWEEIKKYFQEHLGSFQRICIDSSDGLFTQEVYDFCIEEGPPYTAVKDSGTQILKYRWSQMNQKKPKKNIKRGLIKKEYFISIRSDLFKDDLASCLRRNPKEDGAWSFPRGTKETELFTHLNNEHCIITWKKGKRVLSWEKKYSNAPQHYFSALIYSLVGIEDIREKLIRGGFNQKPIKLEDYEPKEL